MPSIRVGFAAPTGPDPSLFRRLVRFGRVVGLDSLLFWDHFQDFTPRSVWRSPGFTWLAEDQDSPHSQIDPATLLASLARSAGGVRLGTGVTETLRHHPVAIAQAALSLATLTKKPPILGVGAGERMNTEPYGIPFDHPVSRFEEAIRIIRLCLDGPGSIDFSGRFFTLEGAPFDLAVPGRTPQVWIAAQGPRMLQIAGRYADGWLPSFGVSPAHYEAAYRNLTTAARQAGRDPTSITASLQVGMIVAPSRREAQDALQSRPIRFHAVATHSAETWKAAGSEHPFGPSYRGFVDLVPETLDRDQLEHAMRHVPDEILRQTFLWGTVDDVVNSIRRLGDAGLQHISLMATSYSISEKLAKYVWRAVPSIIRRLRNY